MLALPTSRIQYIIMESNYPEKNQIEFKLPYKIKEDYLNSGILSVGEGHGIKEYYEFYEKLIRELPINPQLAVEMGYLDKKAIEEYLNGKREGRISFDSFVFLKRMLDEKLITSLIYLDENLNSNSDRDVQMANQFIK